MGSSPSEAVWALVSGLPTGLREQRLVMALQLYIDDSGSNPESPYFVLAGFVSTTEKWARFSDDWKALLDGDPAREIPAIDYFKASEADSLLGQFSRWRGWTERKRDVRVLEFASVARQAGLARVACAMRNDHFEKHIKSLPYPERRMSSDSPYSLLVYNLVLALADRGDALGLSAPCDIICDRQLGFEDEVAAHWPSLRDAAQANGRPELMPWFVQPPIFRDDLSYLPLQAADLYAGNMRRTIRNNETIWMPPLPVLRIVAEVPEVTRVMREPEIIRLRDHLKRVGEQYRADSPEVGFVHFTKGAAKKARNAKKAAAKKAARKRGEAGE